MSRASTSQLDAIREWPDSPTPANSAADVSESGLVILDEDTLDEFARLCETNGQPVPQTFTVATGKGWHFYFARPDGYTLSNNLAG